MLRLSLLLAVLGASLARGDVVTTLSGSKLIVTGDDSRDTVQIEAAPGGVSVVGFDGTLVDGSGNGGTFAGVEHLTVKLRQGGDRLTIRGVDLSGKLGIRLGRASDDIVLDGVRAGATSVRTGGGDDVVSVVGPTRLRKLTVQTSTGEDAVVLDGAWVTGDLAIDTGSDDDYVGIFVTEVADDVDVHLGNDDDFIELADVAFDDDTHVDGEEGDDAAFLYGYIWFGDDVDFDDFDDDWWW